MNHLLDYETLKSWGFIWATKMKTESGLVCTGYLIKQTNHTDMFGFCPISLSVYFHDNLNKIWMLFVLNDDYDVLFKGQITSKTNLEKILKACLIWKP